MPHIPAEDRRFYSTVLLTSAAPAICFGWFFWMAGTGQYLVLSGLVLAGVGVLLATSALRAIAALGCVVVGCWPLIALTVWAAFQ